VLFSSVRLTSELLKVELDLDVRLVGVEVSATPVVVATNPAVAVTDSAVVVV